MTGRKVVVVGGGLAGITAAIELADAGLPVCLVEARPWLGGATCSFGRRGLTVDNGQHVFFRSWSAYRGLLARLGTTAFASIQDEFELTVLAADGQAVLRRATLPPPLHLAGSLARYRLLSAGERLMLLPAVVALRKAAQQSWMPARGAHGDAGFADWLARHGQGDHARRMFWEVLSVPALNVAADQADPALAGSLLAGLGLDGRDSADIGIASVPLSQLHGRPAVALLSRLGVQIRLCRRATAIQPDSGGYSVRIEGDQEPPAEDQLPFEREEPELLSAAAVVLAVPAWHAASLAPSELAGDAARWGRLDGSPVVSLHVVYGGRVTGLRFAATADLPVRWIVDKTDAAGLHTGQYLAAAIPAADRYVDIPAGGLREEFLPLLGRLFPAAASAKVEDFFVTRERRATFRQTRGSAALRPGQETSLAGFAVAGAWTDTGMPDTMEGAVRSGRLAARAVIAHLAGGGTQAVSVAASPDAVAATRQ